MADGNHCLTCRADIVPAGGDDEPCPTCGSATLLRGRWRVLGPLAHGGSSRVFLGHDTEAGRDVALKVLDLADVADWKQVELFERQLPLLRRLRHRGIPEVYDAFEATGGPVGSGHRTMLVLAQSLHRGPNLRDALADGLRFDEASARAFLERMLDILDYLHGFSPPILHRDVKPANILLELPAGGDPNTSLARAQPILIDFDTARGVAIDTATADGTMVGSAGFVPMEQLAGRPVPASDLYGLGMTVIAALSQRDVLDIPVERSRLQFHDFVNVSRELERVLDGLVAPIVEDRYENVAAVRRALAADRSAPPSPSTASRRMPRSRRGLLVSLGAVAVLSVGAGSYALVVGAPEPNTTPRHAEVEGQGAQPRPEPRIDHEPELEPSCRLSFDVSCATSLLGDRTDYGRAIALAGDTLAVGVGFGVAQVHTRTGSAWTEEAVLGRSGRGGLATSGAPSGTIALSGHTLAVSIPGASGHAEDDVLAGSGVIDVYVRDGGWVEQAHLVGARESARLGTDVALDGDTIAAVEEELVAPNRIQTSIAVFVRDGQSWTRTDAQLGRFRNYLELALDGDTLVVSEPTGLPHHGDHSGHPATHVFVREGERWTLQASLPQQQSGGRVALDEDTLAVGDIDGIHVFTRTGSAWTEQAVLRDPVPSTPSAGRQFGGALALHGDLLATIGYTTNYNVNDFDGDPEVLVFARSGRGEAVSWRLHGRIDIAVKKEGGSLALGLDGDTLAVGTPGLKSEDLGWHGAVFLLQP